MMKELTYTLIADGSSDNIFLSVINWALDINYPQLPKKGYWADFRSLPCKIESIPDKLKWAEKLYPFDILFYHRDAEAIDIQSLDRRKQEIHSGLADENVIKRTVCIIPIKMMESWLLFDPEAIKKASGNRNYKGPINLPALHKMEKEQRPKNMLYDILRTASGLRGRNLAKFNPGYATHLVAENIVDFSPLRCLQAFRRFEEELKTVVDAFLAEDEEIAL